MRAFTSVGCFQVSNSPMPAVPSVGRSSPTIMRMVVVLPAPFWPSRP
jgi:hypothetical protein